MTHLLDPINSFNGVGRFFSSAFEVFGNLFDQDGKPQMLRTFICDHVIRVYIMGKR